MRGTFPDSMVPPMADSPAVAPLRVPTQSALPAVSQDAQLRVCFTVTRHRVDGLGPWGLAEHGGTISFSRVGSETESARNGVKPEWR